MTKVGIESKYKCVLIFCPTTLCKFVLPTPPSYLIALSLCGAWIWLADPLVTGRKSKTLSVLTPSVGCRGVRTGLIRRSCISHFTHTTQKANAITSSTRGSTIWVKICRNTLNSAFFALGNSSFFQPIPAVSSSQFRVSSLPRCIHFNGCNSIFGSNRPALNATTMLQAWERICMSLYLGWGCPWGWAAGGGGALGLLPAPGATPSTSSPWPTRCSPPSAGRPRFPTSDCLLATSRETKCLTGVETDG